MANTLWLQNGKLIVDSLGSPLLCSTCPCTPVQPPATYYFYKQLIIAGCGGQQYRSNVVKFFPSTDTYQPGWNAQTTYMSMGDCSGSLVLLDTANNQIETTNIGGLFSLCLGDQQLVYMGRPTSCFQYAQQYSDATGIWPTIKQQLQAIYSSYSASNDDSGDGSNGSVHPDIQAMFPQNTIYDQFSTAADSLKEKARNLAQSTDDIWETLNSQAQAVYSQYYNPAGSTAYNTYKQQYDALSAAHKGSIVGTQSTDDTDSIDGIWQYYVIAPFAKLTYDTAQLMANIQNDTAVVNAKSTLSSYTAPKYSDVIYYQPGAGIGRYTYGVDAIVQAIQNCRDNSTQEQKLEAALQALETVLSAQLDPYSSSMSQRAAYQAQTYRSAKISASDTLCVNMLTNFNMGTATLRQALWTLYKTQVLKFINEVLQIRPIKYTWAVLKTTTQQPPAKDAYTLPQSLLACDATYSYKKYIWHCTQGMVLNKVYTAVPDQQFFNKDTYYQQLWQLQQMAATPAALFKQVDQLFTAVKGPQTNIDSFVHIASGSVWQGLGIPTQVSPVGLESYINNLAQEQMSYYLWGVSNGKATISALPLVEGTQRQLYDFTTISTPVYILCAKQLLQDMTTDISPMGYPDTWTYTMASITGIVKAKEEPDWTNPPNAPAQLILLTDQDSLPNEIKVWVDGTQVTTDYKDIASGSLWFPTKITAQLVVTKQAYDDAQKIDQLSGYKAVTQTAQATVVIKAVGGANKCGSNQWSPVMQYRQFEPVWRDNLAVDPYTELELNPYLTYQVEASQSPELVDQKWNPVMIKPMPSMTITADLLSQLPQQLQ